MTNIIKVDFRNQKTIKQEPSQKELILQMLRQMREEMIIYDTGKTTPDGEKIISVDEKKLAKF